MDAGRPILVEYLVPMDGNSDTDCDLSQDVRAALRDDLSDMFLSDEEGDEPDARSRFAIPIQYQRAKLQEETGE